MERERDEERVKRRKERRVYEELRRKTKEGIQEERCGCFSFPYSTSRFSLHILPFLPFLISFSHSFSLSLFLPSGDLLVSNLLETLLLLCISLLSRQRCVGVWRESGDGGGVSDGPMPNM